MTPEQFDTWRKEHMAYQECKKLREWLGGLSRNEKGEVLVEWMRMLKVVSLDQARKATMRMHSRFLLDSTPPDQHASKVLELARTMRDPVLERQKEAKRREKKQAQAEVRRSLEEKFGAELDRMSVEELQELIETIPERLRHSLRKSMGLARCARQHELIRPTLLKAMQARTVPVKPQTEEELQAMRSDVFGALGETPEFRTNDQWGD